MQQPRQLAADLRLEDEVIGARAERVLLVAGVGRDHDDRELRAAGAQALALSVMVFTGYTLEELETAPLPGSDLLLSNTDVLVDGRYVEDLPETHRAWAGSSNQRFHYLTSRYDSTIERSGGGSQRVEVRVSESGRVELNGWPADFSARGAGRTRTGPDRSSD